MKKTSYTEYHKRYYLKHKKKLNKKRNEKRVIHKESK